MDTSTIVILDFGSQYTQLIARRIREFNVFSVVLPCTAPLEQVKALNPKGVILSGGPCSVYDADAPDADAGVLAMGVPVLGICYGLQFIVHHLGGKVVGGSGSRVWPRRGDDCRGDAAVSRVAGNDGCLDVAWRRGGGAAGWVFADGEDVECGCGDCG